MSLDLQCGGETRFFFQKPNGSSVEKSFRPAFNRSGGFDVADGKVALRLGASKCRLEAMKHVVSVREKRAGLFTDIL